MKRSYLFAAIAILFWSTVATVSKLLLGQLSSFAVLSYSSFFAALALLILNIATGNIKRLRTYRLRDYLITLAIGIPGTFLYYIFYYTGTSLMPASQAFIINYLWPMMSVLFAALILKERMTAKKTVALLLSFLGVAVVAGGGALAGGSVMGAVFCVLGAVSYGIYTALNQRFGYDKRLSMMFFYATSFVLTAIINLARGDLALPATVTLLGLAYNGVLAMALANTAWMLALERGRTARISNLAYLTPFFSLILTSLVLHERPALTSLLGLALILLGILIQLLDGKKTGAQGKK